MALFLAGSEGTLAVITGATVRLVEDPPVQDHDRARLPAMADAADDRPLIVDHRPTPARLDRRIVDVVRRTRGRGRTTVAARGRLDVRRARR